MAEKKPAARIDIFAAATDRGPDSPDPIDQHPATSQEIAQGEGVPVQASDAAPYREHEDPAPLTPDEGNISSDADRARLEANPQQGDPDAEVYDPADDPLVLEVEKGAKKCPHCHGPMVQHTDADPEKAGSWHCNGCGMCWAPGIRQVRAGHPVPTGASATRSGK